MHQNIYTRPSRHDTTTKGQQHQTTDRQQEPPGRRPKAGTPGQGSRQENQAKDQRQNKTAEAGPTRSAQQNLQDLLRLLPFRYYSHRVKCHKIIRFTLNPLCFQFHISRAAIYFIIADVCRATNQQLGCIYFKVPSSKEEWLAIAKQFEERWQYPYCLGAIYGKHIVFNHHKTLGYIFTIINILIPSCFLQ